MKIKTILLPTLVLFLVCGITTAALSLTNSLTKDKIEAAKQQSIQNSMEQLVPGGKFNALPNDNATVYTATVKDTVQYIIMTSAKGYKSDVEVMTAFDESGVITGVVVTGCADESPGIGQKVGDQKSGQTFCQQFIGRTDSSDNFDAITGATISSGAVNDAVNKAIEQFDQLVKGGVIREK